MEEPNTYRLGRGGANLPVLVFYQCQVKKILDDSILKPLALKGVVRVVVLRQKENTE